MRNKFSLRQYYLFSLLFPIILPLTPFLFIRFFTIPEENLNILNVLFFSGVAQYAVFAACIFSKYKKAEVAKLRNLSLIAPLWFAPFYIITFLGGINRELVIKYVNIDVILLMTLYCLAVAYLFVVFTHIIGFILLKIGIVRR